MAVTSNYAHHRLPDGRRFEGWANGIAFDSALVNADGASFELFPDLFGVELLDSPWFWLSLAAVLASARRSWAVVRAACLAARVSVHVEGSSPAMTWPGSTRSSSSSASAFLTRIPLWAPRPVPTIIDIGVARPRAHGQAMISTATAFKSE